MAYFTSPCQTTVLESNDDAHMPVSNKSTYQVDYIAPKHRSKYIFKDLVEATQPSDYLPVDAGKRILPTTYQDIHRNCISTSIGDILELKYQDDTPQWKHENRDAIALNWLKPFSERRNFVKTQEWYLRKNKKSNLNNC